MCGRRRVRSGLAREGTGVVPRRTGRRPKPASGWQTPDEGFVGRQELALRAPRGNEAVDSWAIRQRRSGPLIVAKPACFATERSFARKARSARKVSRWNAGNSKPISVDRPWLVPPQSRFARAGLLRSRCRAEPPTADQVAQGERQDRINARCRRCHLPGSTAEDRPMRVRLPCCNMQCPCGARRGSRLRFARCFDVLQILVPRDEQPGFLYHRLAARSH